MHTYMSCIRKVLLLLMQRRSNTKSEQCCLCPFKFQAMTVRTHITTPDMLSELAC